MTEIGTQTELRPLKLTEAMKLHELKAVVKSARTKEAEWREAYDRMEALLEAQISALRSKFAEENATLIDAYDDAKESLIVAENNLRGFAVEHFNATGEKKLDDQVSVRVTKSLEYDKEIALNWCKERGICLALNKKEFESVALTLGASSFVQVIEKPSAVIAKEL